MEILEFSFILILCGGSFSSCFFAILIEIQWIMFVYEHNLRL
jgi:hypothetical protein